MSGHLNEKSDTTPLLDKEENNDDRSLSPSTLKLCDAESLNLLPTVSENCNMDPKKKMMIVAITVFVFLTTVSFIPITTKKAVAKFNYPVFITFFNLTFSWIVLVLCNVIKHFVYDNPRFNRNMKLFQEGQIEIPPSRPSWIFDSNFFTKLRFIWLVGFCFGIKFFITNLGVATLSANEQDVRLLLQSTSLLWIIILGCIINKERPSAVEICCCLFTMIGTILISIRFVLAINNIAGLFFAILTAFLEGLTVVVLRATAKKLIVNNVKQMGIKAAELTAFKLFVSSMTVLPFLILIEGFPQLHLGKAWWAGKNIDSVFIALGHIDSMAMVYALLTAMLTLVFQVNITVLASVAGAISVGLVGDIKVVPQVLMYDLINLTVTWSPWHVVGGVLVTVSSLLYAYLKFKKSQEKLKAKNASS